MAPARGAAAEGPRQAHGLPRDHQGRDRSRPQQPARARHRPRRRAGDPPHPRPSLRLRGVARAVAQGRPRSLRRPGAVRRDPPRRRPRARAARLRLRRLLGPHGRTAAEARRGGFRLRVEARPHRRQAHRQRPRLRRPRAALRRRRRAERDLGRGTRRRPAPADDRVHGEQPRDQAVHAPAGGTVHDLDTAAGGGPQAPLLGPPDHERGAGSVRERVHHLYAHRLADAVAAGDHGRAQPGDEAVRHRLDPREAPRLHRQVQERARSPRGDPSVG